MSDHAGPQGPIGPQGVIGPQGEIGNAGVIGPQGLQGEIGPIGPSDGPSIIHLIDAFDRLILALSKASRRNVLIAIGFIILLLAGGYQTTNGVKQNRRHIDCVVTVFLRSNPPKCEGVKAQLIKDGILPVGGLFPFPTTSTTE